MASILIAAFEQVENSPQYVDYRVNSRGRKIKDTAKFRKEQVEGVQGQLVAWTDEDLKNEIDKILEKVFKSSGSKAKPDIPMSSVSKISNSTKEMLWADWNARKSQLDPDRVKRVESDYNKHIEKKFNAHVVPVINFRRAREFKSAAGIKIGSGPSSSLTKLITAEVSKVFGLKGGSKELKDLDKRVGTDINIGHGGFGSYSASQVKALEVKRLATLDIESRTDLTRPQKISTKAELNRVFREANDIFRRENKTVIKTHEKLATKTIWQRVLKPEGGMKENYVQVLNLAENAELNQKKGREVERAFLSLIKKLGAEVLASRGSYNYYQSIHASVLKTIVRQLDKGYKLKSKIKPKYEKKKVTLRQTHKADRKEKVLFKRANPITLVEKGALSAAIDKAKGKPAKGSSGINIQSMVPILNNNLQETTMAAMGEPGLVNRTGRFASSVKVVNILSNNSGIVIDYTYQKDPYSVFEDTQPWATPRRDPRVLIDKVIRDRAIESGLLKFTTRRI